MKERVFSLKSSATPEPTCGTVTKVDLATRRIIDAAGGEGVTSAAHRVRDGDGELARGAHRRELGAADLHEAGGRPLHVAHAAPQLERLLRVRRLCADRTQPTDGFGEESDL